MTQNAHRTAAFLVDAHRQRQPFQTLSTDIRPASITAAYQAQQAFHALHLNGGRGPIGGRKIALASKVQQQLCNIDHPIAGGIFKSEIHPSPFTASHGSYFGLGVEYEIAITLTEDSRADQSYTKASVLPLIGSIQPAFELIIDRDADYEHIDVPTMIADNAWCAGVILGPPINHSEIRNINNLSCTLHWNDEPAQHVSSAASDPLGSLAWVLNLVGEMGDCVNAGEPIITGSVLKTRYPALGDEVRFEIDGQSEVSLTLG